MEIRKYIGITFLVIQIGMIVYARFTPSRYFCWAPFDSQNEYVISVNIGGVDLSPKDIHRRYRRPASGLDSRSIQHVKNIIRQYEQTYGKNDHAKVVLRYKVNGVPKEQWQWPPR